jgi:hypothetical protein
MNKTMSWVIWALIACWGTFDMGVSRPPFLMALQAAHTAAVVNELSSEIHKVLAAHPINQQRQAEGLHPANVVLLRGCGSRIKVTPFQQLHGLKAALVAPTKIIAGDVCRRLREGTGAGGWGRGDGPLLALIVAGLSATQ